MERIFISPKGKEILRSIKTNININTETEEEYNEVTVLIEDGLISGSLLLKNRYSNVKLTRKGIAYLQFNPKLKNPSIWEDKKYWITTFISIISIFISIFALYQSYNNG